MTSRSHLLVVDDEAGIRESLSSILKDEGYQVDAVASGEEALARANSGDFEVVLLDVWLPGIDGLQTLSRIQAMQRPPAVIMISGHGTIETAVRATKLGAFDFIENPLLHSELDHRYQVIGDSVPMKAMRQQIAVTAPTNGRVLIYGESGTGKELVARALHAVSLRTQSKVLRVLEDQRFERVGSNETLSVDVRVIAATNKHLEQEIAGGAFRQDLFYRLNVIPFYVPALRDRKEDIPTLARYFLREFSSAYAKKTRELSDSALEILLRYPWPGNVRELRNLVERLVIVCPQARIEPHHLPPELFRGVSESLHQPYSTLHEARSAYEREFILRKLQEHRWNMTQTATALGLERSHLYRKMKSLGIAAPD